MTEPKTPGASEDVSEEAGDTAVPQEEQAKETYVRPIARYVAPPEQRQPPGLRSVYFAFQHEKMVSR